jgi:hypothetical protein
MRRYWKKEADFDGDKLNEAFRRFRALGLIARQSFSCCGGCAGYEIAASLGDKVKKVWDERGPEPAKREFERLQRKIKGVVFYHRQDRDNLEESGWVYLAFGDVEASNVGTFGMPTLEVGKAICKILDEVGLKYEWDGTEHQRICVDVRTDYQREKDTREEEEQKLREARWARQEIERETGFAAVPLFPPVSA